MHNSSCGCHLRDFFVWFVVILLKSSCLAVSCSCAEVDGLSSAASELWVSVVHSVCFSSLFFLAFFGIYFVLADQTHRRCEIYCMCMIWCLFYIFELLLLVLILWSLLVPRWRCICMPSRLWSDWLCIDPHLMLIYSFMHQFPSFLHLISRIWTIEVQVLNLIELLLQLEILNGSMRTWDADSSAQLLTAVLLCPLVIEWLADAECLILFCFGFGCEILVPIETAVSGVYSIYISSYCTVHNCIVFKLVVNRFDFILQRLKVGGAAWITCDVFSNTSVSHPWISIFHLLLLAQTYLRAPKSLVKSHLWFRLCLNDLLSDLIFNLSKQRPLCFLLFRLLLSFDFVLILSCFNILASLFRWNQLLVDDFDLFLIFSVAAPLLVYFGLRRWHWIHLILWFESTDCAMQRMRMWIWNWSLASQKHNPFTVAVWFLGVYTFQHSLGIHFHFERLLFAFI